MVSKDINIHISVDNIVQIHIRVATLPALAGNTGRSRLSFLLPAMMKIASGNNALFHQNNRFLVTPGDADGKILEFSAIYMQ